ncbi:MAG TPA: ABC transporter permease [Egibacteraceae bacterium]|nr:ABC transporter permease [Egibacteraceae bacterium]
MSAGNAGNGNGSNANGGSRLHGAIETYFRLAPVTVPIYAVLVAVVVGSLVMLLAGANPLTAYGALFDGAWGSPEVLARSLARSTPFIIAGLAVAFAFKAGLFNIGAEGQLLMGALTAAWVGTWSWMAGLPAILAVPVVLLAGVAGGLFWGGIPGVLKARTGAHEVIVTIMLNAIALRLAEWIINSRSPRILLDLSASVPHTVPIFDAARMPRLPGTALHLGFLLALLLCAAVWFVLQRSTVGFEIRTVGANPDAARYAGMSVGRTIVLVMAVSGALAGIAGAGEVSGGTTGYLTSGSFIGIGFDSIAIALLARANPFAVIPAAFLWGSLLAGAPTMQLQADVSLDIVRVVQALIILFVAADAIVRWLFRIRAPRDGDITTGEVFAKGWGT